MVEHVRARVQHAPRIRREAIVFRGPPDRADPCSARKRAPLRLFRPQRRELIRQDSARSPRVESFDRQATRYAILEGRMRKLVFIENEGALFRGVGRAWPEEVWSRRQRAFVPYEGKVPKPVDWGTVISEEEAREMVAQLKPPTADLAASSGFIEQENRDADYLADLVSGAAYRIPRPG